MYSRYSDHNKKKVFIRNAYDYNFDEVNALMLMTMMLMKKIKIMTFDMQYIDHL